MALATEHNLMARLDLVKLEKAQQSGAPVEWPEVLAGFQEYRRKTKGQVLPIYISTRASYWYSRAGL